MISEELTLLECVSVLLKFALTVVAHAARALVLQGDVDAAIREASKRRLRPILMTSIATAAGAVPLMIATGAGAAARGTIGTVIVFGVSIATIITLFLIPLLYSRLARFTGSPLAVTRRLEAEIAGGAQPAPAE